MSTQATLFVDSVLCRDEMGGSFREGLGNDEIYLGAIGIDATGAAIKVPFFEVYAHFDDGDVKTFSPPRSLATLGVTDGVPPKCSAILLLAEMQHGGMNEDLSKAHSNAVSLMDEKKADGQDPTVPEVLTEVAKEVGKWLLAESKDKVFPPVPVSVDPNAGVAEFRGHQGIYALNYHWEVV